MAHLEICKALCAEQELNFLRELLHDERLLGTSHTRAPHAPIAVRVCAYKPGRKPGSAAPGSRSSLQVRLLDGVLDGGAQVADRLARVVAAHHRRARHDHVRSSLGVTENSLVCGLVRRSHRCDVWSQVKTSGNLQNCILVERHPPQHRLVLLKARHLRPLQCPGLCTSDAKIESAKDSPPCSTSKFCRKITIYKALLAMNTDCAKSL